MLVRLDIGEWEVDGDHSPADALGGGLVSDPHDAAVHSCLVLWVLGRVKAPCFS